MIERKNILKVFAILALLISNFAHSQNNNVWSLQQCINYALENNLQIKLAKLNRTASAINYNQSKFNKLPNLNGSIRYDINFAGATDPTTFEFTNQRISTNSFSLSSNVILYQGNRQNEQINKTYLQYQVADLDIENAKNDIILAITQAFLNVLLGKEQLKSLINQNTLTKQQKQNIEKSIEYGVLPEGDILNIESQLIQEDANITIAKNNIDIALLNLKQLLDLDFETVFDILNPQINFQSISIEKNYNTSNIISTALILQPAIKKANLQVAIAKSDLGLALSAYYPTLSLNGGLNTSYSSARQEVVNFVQDGISPVGFIPTEISAPLGILDTIPVVAPNFTANTRKIPYFTQLNDNFLQFVSLNLQVPIFNKYTTKNNVSLAKINYHSAKLQNEIAINNLEKEINQAYLDALAAFKNYKAAEKASTSLFETYQFTKKRYDLGATTFIDLLQAQSRYANADLDKNSNKFRYIFALKILDFYKGNAIKL